MASSTTSSAGAPMQSNGHAAGAGAEKVTSLLETLRTDLMEKNLLPQQRNNTLEELKVLGRSKENAASIFTKDGIEILAKHSFDGNSATTSREAMRCLANAMFLAAPTRQMLVDLGYAGKAAEKLKSENSDDEFLASRIMFLLTYDTNADFAKLNEGHQICDSINRNIARHSKRYSKKARRVSSAPFMEGMAITESLKLIFNITHFYPDLADQFSKSIPELCKILVRTKIERPPLQQPMSSVVNALLNLNLNDKSVQQFGCSPIFPKFDKKCNAEHLINILDRAITDYPEAELDVAAGPVLTLIRKVYEIAPDNVQKFMQWLLLPSDAERAMPLGKSDTLSSRLLRLSTSALTPTLRNSISAMMFELSGKDANEFVRNVGYGFASGFLMSQGMPMPESAEEAYSTGESKPAVNPVTGQRLENEPKDTGLEMTEEEKEQEAERLFVLFERLKATGVVKVKNPVEQAVDEGRFEELPD